MQRTESLPYSKLETGEDILELLCLWHQKGIRPEVSRICQHFEIDRRKLSVYLRQLYEYNYIESPGIGDEILLTPYGIATGNDYIYRHNSISQLLQLIGVQEKTADQDACRIEHIVTDESARAICQFVNYENMYYERRIHNSELTDRYDPGIYKFVMQMYSLEHRCPRKLKEEYHWYARDIFLEIGQKGYFELQKLEKNPVKSLWYKSSNGAGEWIKAETGAYGERIPASAFEFIVKPDDRLIEGNVLIAFMSKEGEPEIWECGQLEVEIW